MIEFLLDTNIVIAALNGRSSAVVAKLAAMRPVSAISAVVSHELAFGAYNSARPVENLRKLHRLGLETLDLTGSDAIAAGKVRAALKRQGTPIGSYDVLIAGQALARDLTLVTNNTGEFARVAGLRLEDWTA